MGEIRVFISYSHDSPELRNKVHQLSERLRNDGIHSNCDHYVNGTPDQGWPRWMMDEIGFADYVLIVCTETYYRRFRGHDDSGKGADFEGAIITSEIYETQSNTNKFVPVFLSNPNTTWIPEILRSRTHYDLTRGEDEYRRLYDFLLGQAGAEPGSVGKLKRKPRQTADPLTFDEQTTPQQRKFDISRISESSPTKLVGRVEEMAKITEALNNAVQGMTDRPRVISIVAWGGEGKTFLVSKWAAELAKLEFLECDRAFAWSFYHQGEDASQSDSSDLFLHEALVFFGNQQTANSSLNSLEKGRRLADLIGKTRSLLILDGLETLQHSPLSHTTAFGSKLKDQGVAALLKGLATFNNGLCVVTTRFSISDLSAFSETTARELPLKPLSRDDSVALLKSLGVVGPQSELEKLADDVHRHALTLALFGQYLKDAHGGNISERHRVNISDVDANIQGGHAFRIIETYVKYLVPRDSLAKLRCWLNSLLSKNSRKNYLESKRILAILRLLGLFDRPLNADCLKEFTKAPAVSSLTMSLVGMSDAERNFALSRLEGTQLISVIRNKGSGDIVSVNTHPLVRAYFAEEISREFAVETRKCHQRLFEYFKSIAPDRADSLSELSPLIQAVRHGCLAGRPNEAFDLLNTKIRRLPDPKETIYYTFETLGAYSQELSILRNFFLNPWRSFIDGLTPENEELILANLGYALRGLGYPYSEVHEPMEAALNKCLESANWQDGTIVALHLGEYSCFAGDLGWALYYGACSIECAEKDEVLRGNDASEGLFLAYSGLGATLIRAGLEDRANLAFLKAKQYYAKLGKEGLEYYSFLHWEFLEHTKKTNASQFVEEFLSSPSDFPLSNGVSELAKGLSTLHEIEQSIDSVDSDDPRWKNAETQFDSAIDQLRRGGTVCILPRALVAFVRYFCLFAKAFPKKHSQDFERRARSYLDQAKEISQRSQLKTFSIDVVLAEARIEMAMGDFHKAEKLVTEAVGLIRGCRTQIRPYTPKCQEWKPPSVFEELNRISGVDYTFRDNEIAELRCDLSADNKP